MENDWLVQPAGETIRRMRQDHFWTQEQLADAAGLRKRTVERAEAGQRLRRSTVQALAQALGCLPNALVRPDYFVETLQDRDRKPASVLEQENSLLAFPSALGSTLEPHAESLVERCEDKTVSPLPTPIVAVRSVQAGDEGIYEAQHSTSDRDRVDTMVLASSVIMEPVHARISPTLHPVLPCLEPGTDRAAIAMRLAQLPMLAQSLLRIAAVIGEEVPLSLIQAVIGLPLESLLPTLTHLQTSGWLAELGRVSQVVYTFIPPSIQRVIYETLPREQRCVVHAQAVEALAQQCPDRIADISYHAFQGELWDKAVVYSWQAAEQAVTHGVYRQAMVYFEQVLIAIGHLPVHDDARRQMIDLQFDLSNALVVLGDIGCASNYLRESASLAETLDDGRRLGQACALLTFAYWLAGAYPRASTSGRRALAIAKVLDNFPARVGARLSLGQVYLALGDYAQAQDCFRKTIACPDDGLRHDLLGMPGLPAVLSRAWLGCGLAEMGAFAEGQTHCEEAVRMAEAVGHRFSLAVACYGAGVVSLYKGDYAQATHCLERGLALCQDEDLPVWFPWIASGLGAAYARCGRVTASLPLLEQAVERADHMGIMAYQARRLAWLGEAYLLAGRMAEAHECAERALTLARDLREPGSEGQALWLRAEVAIRRAPLEREVAETSYHQAQPLAEACGMRPLLAHCRLGLGTLYEALDEPELARRELSFAAELFRSMDMTFWVSRTEAALTRMA